MRSISFSYLIRRLMSYFFCFNVGTLSIGFGHRNCVVIGCPNSGQRLGKWAATTCELHGCNKIGTFRFEYEYDFSNQVFRLHIITTQILLIP